MPCLLDKILNLSMQIILVFLFCNICVKSVYSADSTGQKAHFQVEDKSGDLKIVATKDLAKVTSQADSVEVVVKPGMADYPVLKSDKPIVHVVNGCCGWNSISVKKSSILAKNNKIRKANKSSKERRAGWKWSKLHKHYREQHKFITKNLRFNSRNSAHKKTPSVYKNFKPFSSIQKPKTLVNFKKSFTHEKASFRPLFQNTGHRLEERRPNKKSTVLQTGEVGFQVTGSAGKLNMDVTKSGTKLSSESGAVDVLLKRKAGGNSGSTKQKDVIAFAQMMHVAPELVGGEFDNVGLRKSDVPEKRRHKTRS